MLDFFRINGTNSSKRSGTTRWQDENDRRRIDVVPCSSGFVSPREFQRVGKLRCGYNSLSSTALATPPLGVRFLHSHLGKIPGILVFGSHSSL
jgi:hypothetical protein